MFSQSFRQTLFVRVWSFLKIPALAFIRPTVVELNERRTVVRVRLRRRTRNHLSSMYFGVLCAGADCAGGLIAMLLIRNGGNRVSLIFKDFHAEFLRRPQGDVDFVCEDGEAIAALVQRVTESGEREHIPVTVRAFVPSESRDEPVARFTLTLSLKRR
ncbi:MAG TPA: DUF4442 domain-containing protein [Thermoanaerobaculia bacterium]|nr:DUF4442 domain-containing protein [Thermoanaerobaculia bacterium]